MTAETICIYVCMYVCMYVYKGDSGGSDVDLLKRVKFSAVEHGEITRYLQEDDKKRALLSRLLQRAAVGQAFQAQLADDCAHDIVIARTREVYVLGIVCMYVLWMYSISMFGCMLV